MIDPLERWREYGEKPDYAGLLSYGGAPYTQDASELAGVDVAIVGGGDLAGQFNDAGLLDEVIVSIAPVTIGAGAPLLPRRIELRLDELGRNGDFVAARFSVVR